MADEDEIRDLIGRMAGAQRQGFHVSPAAMRIVLAALRFYLAACSWLAKAHADPQDDAPRKATEKYVGPAVTVGDLRRLGLVAAQVQCAGPNCWHATRVSFEALGLMDADCLVDVPRLRRFRCSRCAGRDVRVSPDWTDHAARGNGRRSAEDPPAP